MSDEGKRTKRRGGSKGRLPKRMQGHDPALGLAREVRRNAFSISGFFNHGRLSVAFESGLERWLIAAVSFMPEFVTAQAQPVRIEYVTEGGRSASSYPDLLVEFVSGKVLFDVKPFGDLTEDWEALSLKFRAAEAFAKSQGWQYRIATDNDLNAPYVINADFLMQCRLNDCSHADLALALEAVRSGEVKDTEALVRHLSPDILQMPHWQKVAMKAVADLSIHVDLDRPIQGRAMIKTEPYVFRMPGHSVDRVGEMVRAARLAAEQKRAEEEALANAPKVVPVLVINVGASYRIGNELVTIVRFAGVTTVTVVGANGAERNVHLSDLEPLVADGIGGELLDRPWADLTPQQQAIASARLPVIRALAHNRNRAAPVIEEAARKLGVSTSYLFRLIKRYEMVPMPSSLAPLRRGPREKKIDAVIETEIEAAINQVMMTPQRKTLSALQRAVAARLAMVGLKVSDATVRRRYLAKDPRILIAARNSPAAARQLLHMDQGKHQAYYPLHVVQVDSTWFDVFLKDEDDRRTTTRRAYLTVAIDVYSRVVLGFYLSYRPPGSATAGQCIYNAVSPKGRFLRDLKIDDLGEVPYGLFSVLHIDGGKEFSNSSIASFASEYDISFHLRPTLKPHWGGHIESLLDKVAGRLKEMLGATFSNAQERGDYDSEGNAIMTLSDAQKWLTTFFWGEYHHSEHSGIGMTPMMKFAQGLLPRAGGFAAGAPRVCRDYRRLMLQLMPKYYVTVQDYGIRLDYLLYRSASVDFWRFQKHPENKKFEVRRDPDDVTRLFFRDPRTNEYNECPLADVVQRPYSKEEIEDARAYVTAKGWETSMGRILRARQQLDEIETTAKHKTLNARGRAALKKESRKNAGDRADLLALPAPAPLALPSPDMAAALIEPVSPTSDVDLSGSAGVVEGKQAVPPRVSGRSEQVPAAPVRPVVDLSKLRKRR